MALCFCSLCPVLRRMLCWPQGHSAKQWPLLVHNATGELGELSAYRVRSNFTALGARSVTLATFVDDKTAAVVRSDVGEGKVTQFGFMPATPRLTKETNLASCPPPLRLTKETNPASTAVFLS